MSECRRRQMSQFKQRANSPFLGLFVLFRPSAYWVTLTCIVDGDPPYSVY